MYLSSRSPLMVAAVVVVLAGCGTDDDPPVVATWIDGTEVARYDVGVGVGVAPAATRVRALNAWGASVAADPVDASVGGVPQRVVFDGHGYGSAWLDTAGSATVDVGGALGEVHATQRPWAGFGMQRAAAGHETIAVAEGTGGMLVAEASAVWWVGYDGDTHAVLAPDDGAVVGLHGGHLDQDGLLDAVVWTDTAFVLLRGRPGGGMSWAGGIEAPPMAPVAAAIGEVSRDAYRDVALTFADDGDGAFEVWEGRGGWAFAPVGGFDMAQLPVGIAIGDAVRAGFPQITVTRDDGEWTRLAHAQRGVYEMTGPTDSAIGLGLPPGTIVLAEGDYNGDGAEELFLVGPLLAGNAREIQIWDLLGSRLEYLRYTPTAAYVDLEDGNSDGLVDLFALADDQNLAMRSWSDGESAVRSVVSLPAHAPFAVQDQDADGQPEVLLAGPDWSTWWHGGVVSEGDSEWWALEEPVQEQIAGNATGPVAVSELDGDDKTIEVVSFAHVGGNTLVRLHEVDQGAAPAITLIDELQLEGTEVPVFDVAVCQDRIYVAMDGALVRVDVSGATLSEASRRTIEAERVDCGNGPQSSDVAVIVAGAVQLRTAGLAFIDQLGGTAEDVALVALQGSPVAVSCDDPGCTVTRWAWGAGGEEAAVTGSASGVSVNDGVQVSLLGGVGEVHATDLDGDGVQDLLVRDGSTVTAWRSTGHGWGSAGSFHTSRTLAAIAAGDATGDGSADLVFVANNGTLRLTLDP